MCGIVSNPPKQILIQVSIQQLFYLFHFYENDPISINSVRNHSTRFQREMPPLSFKSSENSSKNSVAVEQFRTIEAKNFDYIVCVCVCLDKTMHGIYQNQTKQKHNTKILNPFFSVDQHNNCHFLWFWCSSSTNIKKKRQSQKTTKEKGKIKSKHLQKSSL